jgi:hypothetical protein
MMICGARWCPMTTVLSKITNGVMVAEGVGDIYDMETTTPLFR